MDRRDQDSEARNRQGRHERDVPPIQRCGSRRDRLAANRDDPGRLLRHVSAMPKPPAKRAGAKKPAVDWIAVLRTGDAGVRKWDPARADDRYAVDFTGADLSGCELTGARLLAAQADRASFARSAANVTMTGAQLAGADFTGADLSRADLTYVTAPKA